MKNRTNKTAGPIRKCREGKRTSEKGFTLIETAIAMVVMAIVGLGVASVFFYAASNTANAADREMAAAVAQQRIEQLRNVAFADAILTATAVSGTTTTVTRGGRIYSIVTTIADSNVVNGEPTLKTITIQVIPQAANQSWATSTTSLFGSVTLVSERSAPLVGPNRAL
jgi:prepilin-type N-terminal cleavage/methylation domain-containing protein